jgi:hypothetical protein
MAKITLPNISSGFNTVSAFNNALNQIEQEFQNKVLYRNNPTGEPNQMSSDIDMNGNSILNAGSLFVDGQDIIDYIQNYLALLDRVTVSTASPSGGQDGDIWFKVSS